MLLTHMLLYHRRLFGRLTTEEEYLVESPFIVDEDNSVGAGEVRQGTECLKGLNTVIQ